MDATNSQAVRTPDRCYVCGCTTGDRCRVHGLECVMLLSDRVCSACASIEQSVAEPDGRDWLIRLLVETMSDGKPIKPPAFVPCVAERASAAKLVERLSKDTFFRQPLVEAEQAHNEMPAALAGGADGDP